MLRRQTLVHQDVRLRSVESVQSAESVSNLGLRAQVGRPTSLQRELEFRVSPEAVLASPAALLALPVREGVSPAAA